MKKKRVVIEYELHINVHARTRYLAARAQFIVTVAVHDGILIRLRRQFNLSYIYIYFTLETGRIIAGCTIFQLILQNSGESCIDKFSHVRHQSTNIT